MNYGPLEFAAYRKRTGALRKESAAVSAARASAPVPGPAMDTLTIISGGSSLTRIAPDASVEAEAGQSVEIGAE